MLGKIILAGGDEFRENCVEMDRAIIASIPGGQPKALIVPTAAVTGPQKAANDGVVHFSGLGATASSMMVLDHTDANGESMIGQVMGSDVIYFTGGSPDHLLSTLKGSKLLAELHKALENGAFVGGSSAGAMVMGSKMRRPRAGGWIDALGIAPGIAVLPHHERSAPDVVSRELVETDSEGLVVLGIDAQSCCIGSPGDWRALGSGKVTVYNQGSWQVFNSGDKLPLDMPR